MARQDQANDQFEVTSFLYGGNADYIEQLQATYEDDPESVSPQWRDFFDALKDDAGDVKKNARGASWAKPNWPVTANGELVSALDGNWGAVEKVIDRKVRDKAVAAGKMMTDDEVHQATRDFIRAIMMIRAYRMRGHLHADLDPLKLANPIEDYNELSPSAYGFEEADYDRKIFLDNVLGLEFATVRQMLDILTRTYCSTIGVEFMHISDPEEKAWIQERIEGPDKGVAFTPEGKRAILQKLIESEGFEQFIDVKYKGTKRFGLDGAESSIPALEQIVKRGGSLGMKEIVLGMAHRGRLNVLTNVMAKPHRAVFHEFKGGSYAPDDVEGSGDVKYHLGASSDREFDGNKVHLSLTANPSHLEIVDPVVMGKARAKQDQVAGRTREEIVPLEERAKVLPLLLHGDAAFAGQGVVAECLGSVGLEGTSRRRHAALHHQQPDRLYHQSALLAFLALSIRRSEDDRGADLPCERRRPGGRCLRLQGGDRVSHEVPQAGRHRHVLLPALRPQRRRRAGVHAADHVFDHPCAQDHRAALCRQADCRGSPHAGGFEKMRADWRATSKASGKSVRPTSRTRPTGWTAHGRVCALLTARTKCGAARQRFR